MMPLWILLLLAVAAPTSAAEPAFRYDPARTEGYLIEPAVKAGQPSAELRRELEQSVDEMLHGPWAPLYSDYSAGEAGGVGLAEWCFTRPGEYLRAGAAAAPFLDAARKRDLHSVLREMVAKSPPARQVYLASFEGKPRSVRRTPRPWLPNPDQAAADRMIFQDAYWLWAYAADFDAWDEVRPMMRDLEAIRCRMESRDDFFPAYPPEHSGVLTRERAAEPEYRFRVYLSLLAGNHDNYGYRGAGEARRRMQKDKPVFEYVKYLAGLIGYYRLSRHFENAAEADWARATFEKVAVRTVSDEAAPFLWSDPSLCPEIGRLLRDAAGPWLDELAKTPSVGNLPAVDWDGRVVPGRRDFFATNAYTWQHAWGGQGEGVRPRTVLGAYLVQAWLFRVPAEQLADDRDIPWCQADLYYAVKLAALLSRP